MRVHDEWALGNRYQIENVTGDHNIYDCDTPEAVYRFVSELSPINKRRLGRFVPFAELPESEQRKSMIFVSSAIKNLVDSVGVGIDLSTN